MKSAIDEMAAVWKNPNIREDFSSSATVIPFDPPIPLLRGPVPAGPTDDPSAGAFVLAFPSAAAWRSAFRSNRSKITHQCMLAELSGFSVARCDGVLLWKAGARVGCSVSASNKCKPPWWKQLFGASEADYAEREQCEEREMSSCLAAAEESCVQLAKDKCLPPFRDARISFREKWKGAPQLIFYAPDVAAADELGTVDAVCKSNDVLGDTNYRGSILLEKK